MKDGKVEVVKVWPEKNGDLLVTVATREDRDHFVAFTRSLTAPGTTFEFQGETTILCKRPRQ